MSSAAPLSSTPLACPDDHTFLEVEPGALACPSCGRRFPLEDRIADFMDAPNDFYEGAYRNEVRFLPKRPGWLYELPLWLVSNGYVWTARKFLPSGGRVLELGCAGGVAWFGRRFDMMGADFSLASLQLAVTKYGLCLRTDAARLPLPDASLDGVISSYFWEHIAPDHKPVLLAEIARVLKPGGRIVFVYDIATENPLIATLRKQKPDLYNQEFIEKDGHIGYQSADENDELFQQGGFRLVMSRPMERTPLQSPSVYEKMTQWNGSLRAAGKLLRHLGRRPVWLVYSALLRLIDETVGRALPRRWGRITLVVAEKP